ncbi:hypothetical protein D3C76_1520840 [compost metagenome]
MVDLVQPERNGRADREIVIPRFLRPGANALHPLLHHGFLVRLPTFQQIGFDVQLYASKPLFGRRLPVEVDHPFQKRLGLVPVLSQRPIRMAV